MGFLPDRLSRMETAGAQRTPAPQPSHVLIADDDASVVETIRLILRSEGYRIDTAHSPAGVLAALSANISYDAVLIDLNYARDTTSGKEGIDLISTIRNLDPDLPVIVMTAWASVSVAVEALRRGARDFIEKPFEPARLKRALASSIELQ